MADPSGKTEGTDGIQDINDTGVNKDTLKDLYNRYNQCRDQELDRFWKNSTYVWIFLALCFGGFSRILLKYLEIEVKPEKQYYFDMRKTYETILTIIGFMGLLCSFIWVWMARGMKAWYEVFEMAVWQMDKDNALNRLNNQKYNIENFWRIKDSRFVLQKALFGSDSNSTSKIVILIGRLLCVGWFIAFMWSMLTTFNVLEHLPIMDANNHCVIMLFVLSGLLVVIYFCHFFIQSSTLLTDGEAEIKDIIEKIVNEKLNNGNKINGITIIRFCWWRRFNIDIEGNNVNTKQLANNLQYTKDDKSLSRYFTIKECKQVNEHRIKVRCRAKQPLYDLLNLVAYNKH